MNRIQLGFARDTLDWLATTRLATREETGLVRSALDDPLLGGCLERAETIHLHVKVDDTERLPRGLLEAAGGVLDHARAGFVKYRLPGGVNAIFSHIPVSADDLAESVAGRLARPFLDHIGIDMRIEDRESRFAFEALPTAARERGWAHVPQGGPGQGVRCCHAEVSRKHWLFPRGAAARPIEIAFGPLRHRDGRPGCDLRPAHPDLVPLRSACCGKG